MSRWSTTQWIVLHTLNDFSPAKKWLLTTQGNYFTLLTFLPSQILFLYCHIWSTYFAITIGTGTWRFVSLCWHMWLVYGEAPMCLMWQVKAESHYRHNHKWEGSFWTRKMIDQIVSGFAHASSTLHRAGQFKGIRESIALSFFIESVGFTSNTFLRGLPSASKKAQSWVQKIQNLTRSLSMPLDWTACSGC